MLKVAINLERKEDDGVQCVDRIRPELQSLINQGFRLNALIWAINLNVADLVKLRRGDGSWLGKITPALPKLNRKQRDQAHVCYRRIHTVRDDLRLKGFSVDAIMWALIGAIRNILRESDLPPVEVEQVSADMMMRLNIARRGSIH